MAARMAQRCGRAGVAVRQADAATFIDCVITGNTASHSGGGAYFDSTTSIYVSNTVFAMESARCRSFIASFMGVSRVHVSDRQHH